ncbi:MAG: hypothetical protein ABFD49_10325 [Armatimonadota bacterium]|nr:hypothetical protein [bacterium]
MKRKVLPVLFVVAAVCIMSHAQAEPIKLEYKFTKGEVDKYKVATDITVQGVGAASMTIPRINMTVKSTMLQKTIEVMDDGSAVVEITTKDAQTTGSLSSQASSIPDSKVKVTISKLGQVSSIEAAETSEGNSGNVGANLSKIFGQAGQNVIFPSDPVDVGSSWQSSYSMLYGGGSISINSTLASSEEQLWDQSAARIKQNYSGTMDLAQVLRAVAGNMQGEQAQVLQSLTGSVNLKGTADFCFAPVLGKVLTGSGITNGIISINLPMAVSQSDNPTTVCANVDVKISVTRFK